MRDLAARGFLLLGRALAVFVLLAMLMPFTYAVWMSFHDFFFAAPGAIVERPFVQRRSATAVSSSPTRTGASQSIVASV